jgi:protease secretion system outer membrane protein
MFSLSVQSMSHRMAAVCLACALACVPATGYSLDLLQAYQAASTRDASILSSRANAEAARERIPQAYSQLLPSVSASIGRNQNQLSRSAPGPTGAEVTSESRYGSSNQTLTLRQPLYRTYQWAQHKQAKAQVADSDAAQQEDEQNLAVRVTTAYFDVLFAKDQLGIIQSQKSANLTYLDAARKRLAAGAVTRTDADEAQARVDVTLAQEVEVRQQVDFALRQLQTLVGQPVDKVAALDIAKPILANPLPDSLDAWIDRAELNNQQFKSLRAKVEAARIEIDKAYAGHHPTIDLVAQIARSDSENQNFINSRYTNASLGLQLNVPLYAGGSVNSAVRQALASYRAAEQALEAGRRDLGARVHREFRSITESLAKAKALEQSLRSIDQLIISNQRSLQAGSRTLVDVLNAEQQKTNVLRDLAQARYLHVVSGVRLLALVDSADAASLGSANALLVAEK